MSFQESSQYSEGPLGEPRETLIIKRSDIIGVHDFARANCDPRDYLLIRLPMNGRSCIRCPWTR